MKTLVQSPQAVAPAGTYENVIFFREGLHLDFDLDAPTAAAFTIERLEPMTAGEVLAFTAGRVRRPGLYIRAVNRSAEPRIFRAQAMTTLDPAVLQASIERAADEAWTRGGDAIGEEELRLVFEAVRARGARPPQTSSW